ncbi:hypothetical protein DJ568_12020 [Mucilaginibacter hurinus]|uniref:Uncharacterized protein n=1 Tax=Mucilaginibacter hurinus TaxID=2201324 RepID=A0A367GPF9_9SPHI|nr:hypothetical protein [Mucilaginibacter hurinus]RCH54541.1 hypothetical protein DJ568_12020 [Mucilaginibacter hurinus]
MKKALPFILAAIALFSSSCRKDISAFGGRNPGSPDTSKGYLPITKGSYWKIVSDIVGSAKDTALQTVTGRIVTINGKPYHEVSTESILYGRQTSYLYVGEHKYLSRSTSLREGVTAELVYLVDTAAVGDTWETSLTDDGLVNGFPAKLVGKLIEQDIKKTVAGITYNNVVHTTLDIQYNVNGTGFTSYGTYDVYLAKGVGVIQTDSKLNGVATGSSKVISYSAW